MPSNRRSRLITQGVARSPNRAMLRAVGFGDGDFEKPIVGVANGHSTMNPCNAGIQPLVDRAMAALKAAGAMPQVFGFPTVTDGIGMGTEGMKYSLVSREVIADSIEVAVNGQLMDGVLCVGGCDKNMPGSMMAMARINVPGDLRLRRHDQARALEGPGAHHRLAVRGGRRVRRRQDVEGGLRRHRAQRVPDASARAAASTRPTRCRSSFEALGMSLLGSSQMASPDPEKADSAAASARVLVEAVEARSEAARHHHAEVDRERDRARDGDRRLDQRGAALPRDRVRRRGRRGRSTISSASGRRVPVLCDLKPSGRYVAVDFHRAGGVPQVLKMLLDARAAARRLHDDHRPHDRRGARRRARRAARRSGRDPAVVDKPMYAQGHLAILKGNLAPEGCVAKITGLKNPSITGPARVFDSEPAVMDAIMAKKIKPGDVHRHPLRRAEGRARACRRCWRRRRR